MNLGAIISALVILFVFVPLLGAAVVAALGLGGWMLLRDRRETAVTDESE